MRKFSLVLSLTVLASYAATAMAQDSTYWFDMRDNRTNSGAAGVSGQLITTGAPAWPYTNGQEPAAGGGNSANRFGATAINAGRRGAGEVLRISPVQANGAQAVTNPNGWGSGWPNYDADTNASTGRLWLYMDMADDGSGIGDCYSSMGLDTNLSNGPNLVTQRNTIGSVAMTVFNDASVAADTAGAGSTTPWNGVVNGASNLGSPPSIIGSKAVRVPVTTGPVYNAALGLQPVTNGNPYRVARLDVTAGTRNCTQRAANTHVDNSTYGVKLSVNSLLVTRVFSSGGDGNEMISMGYDPIAGAGTLDAAVSGNTATNTSATLDAIVQVRLRYDFNGDGNVNALDGGGMSNALSVGAATIPTAKVSQIYLGDNNGDRKVNALDGGGFSKALSLSGVSPCP